MFKKAWVKKPITVMLAVLITVGLAVSAFAAVGIGVSNPVLIFSGINITSNNDTVQGFLNVSVKDVENAGVGFTLEYDTDYVILSNASDNTKFDFMSVPVAGGFLPATNPSFFEINEDVFNSSDVTIVCEKDTGSSSKYEAVNVNFSINGNAPESEYIKEKTLTQINPDGTNETTMILDSVGKTVMIGSLSFQIKDPAAFAKLSSNDLSKIFRIKNTNTGKSLFQISSVDITSYPPVIFYDETENLNYIFNVENTMTSVTLDVPSMAVTADEIFKDEGLSDIMSWINTYMNAVTVKYADGTTISDTITWGDTSMEYQMTGTYNVKGGSYTFTQKYNDKFGVKASLTVQPVNITGYVTDNAFIAYDKADVPSDISDSAMQLPTSAHVIFDKMITNGNGYTVALDADGWTQTSGPALSGGDGTTPADFFTDKEDGEYIFETDADTDALPRWVTVGDKTKAGVARGIGPQTEAPETQDITASVDDSGLLTVIVSYSGGTSISDMQFIVRMPNGLMIDPDAVRTAGGTYTTALDENNGTAANGYATIKIKAGNTSDAIQLMLSQYINLGNRGGSFGLAAKKTGELQSDFTAFTFNPRSNYYLAPSAGSTNYTFDYSGVKAGLFTLGETSDTPPIPLTVTLPSTDAVNTTYSGSHGAEPGSLKTITVDSWSIESGTVKAGETVVLKGTLADTYYSGYGDVINKDGITVTLKLTVTEAPEEEEIIENIDDFVFNKKQIGYSSSSVQSADFTVKNIGNIDIYGANVSLGAVAGDSTFRADNFIVTGQLPYTLSPNNSAVFTITPKAGLAVGEYRAKVTVSSNRTAALDTFEIKFVVTDKPVYDIELLPSIPEAGTLSADDGYSYSAGEEVNIKAKVNTDYIFKGWEVKNESGITVTFTPSASATSAAFTMPDVSSEPDETLHIEGVFEETLAAKLRANNLIIMEDDADNTVNDLLGSNFKKTVFDPLVGNYNVVVGNLSDKNKAWFALKNESAQNFKVTATVTTRSGISGTESAPVTLTLTNDTTTNSAYYTEAFDLAVSPVINRLTITLSANDGTETASRSYSVDIYRKPKSEDLITFGYGNSPYGLIMKDDNITNKASSKNLFDTSGNSFTSGNLPEGAVEGLKYYADAWGLSSEAHNYDKDDYALFVYNGYSFTDPGIVTAVNSIGEAIDTSTVSRTVTVMELTAENPSSLINDMREVTEVTHTLASDMTAPVKILDGRVRPGIYSIDYSFKDFDGSTATVSRPLIVLYQRGDVDLSNMVDQTDAKYIERRFRAKLPYGNVQGFESGSMLALYRIVDVNIDRNVNIGDSNYIKTNTDEIKEFYTNGGELIKNNGIEILSEGGDR